jgi:serine/threonine protein phosphatase 1
MSLTFVVPDIHGRFDLLTLAWESICDSGWRKHPGSKVVFLGDYVDRGPDSEKVLTFLVSGQKQFGWVCLKGNHEQMMSEALAGKADRQWWISSGGGKTLDSYGDLPDPVRDRKVAMHCKWIDALPLFHADKHRFFVHAGVAHDLPLWEQPEDTLLWRRYTDADREGYLGKHLVHGHTPSKRNPQTWGDRTCLDAGAFKGGPLTVGVFDDDTPGGPVEILRINV